MIEMKHLTMEQTAQTMTYTGGATAFVGGLALNEIGIIVGIFVGVTGLCFQIWLGMRRDKRDRELHARKMSGAE